jgi:hypothetical protein
VGDGADARDGLCDLVRILCVVFVVAVDEDDPGADLLGFADLRAGLDAKRLGLVAGGDAAVVSAIVGTTAVGLP